jgi:sporulation protein YlmC with PRC-barrel domain
MQISARQIAGSKVFDSDGKPLGKISGVFLDPEKGNILAFGMYQKAAKYISPQDVISWKGNYLILGQEYEIHDAEDLIRLTELLKSQKHGILGKKVQTESGTTLGIATNFHINSKYFLLSNVTVHKSFFSMIPK